MNTNTETTNKKSKNNYKQHISDNLIELELVENMDIIEDFFKNKLPIIMKELKISQTKIGKILNLKQDGVSRFLNSDIDIRHIYYYIKLRIYFEKYIRNFYNKNDSLALLLYLILYKNEYCNLKAHIHIIENLDIVEKILNDEKITCNYLETISEDINSRDFYWWMNNLFI